MGKGSLEEEFVELKCSNCGGPISLTKEQTEEFFVKVGEDFVYIGVSSGQKEVTCPACGSKFIRKEKYQPIGGGGVVVLGNVDTNGGDFIGGDCIKVAGPRSVVIRGRVPRGTIIVTGDDDE